MRLGLVLVIVAGCGSQIAGPELAPSPLSAEDYARSVLVNIEAGDLAALAAQVDPESGLTFSPYGFVDVEDAITLTSTGLVSDWQRNRRYTWGAWDGSGEPMQLSMREYFARFVYDRDYLKAPEVAVNRLLGRGNTLNNLDTVFPAMTFVEFHYPGQEDRYAGLDWSSLRCVLREREGGGWWLVALVHDQWTI